MRTAKFLALSAVCLLAAAFAAPVRAGEPDWAEDWDAGLKEAQERNCPVILVAPRKMGTFKPSIFPELFRDKDIVALSDNFVCFYAEAERYGKIDTVYAARYVKPDKGRYGSHQVILCKPDGAELEKLRLFDIVPKDKVIKNMKTALKGYPGVITKREYRLCSSLRDRAELFRELGAYSDAIETYKLLAKKKSGLEFVKEAQGKPEALAKEAAEQVAQAAKALSEGSAQEKKEALAKLHIYQYGMKKLDCHKKVKDALDAAKKDGKLREDYNRALKNAKAFEQFVRGEQAFLEGDYKSAMKAYKRITRGYGETQYYDKAKARIQEIVDKLTPPKPTTP